MSEAFSDTVHARHFAASYDRVLLMPAQVSTGRRSLSAMLHEWLERAERDGRSFAFVLVGIDQFNRLNDVYGFDIVDRVIEIFGRRLSTQIAANEAMGRFAAGTFGLLLHVDDDDELTERVQQVVSAVNGELPRTDAGAVAAAVSAGAVIVPGQANGVAQVFSRAYDTLYQAQSANRGGFEIFVPTFDRERERQENLNFADGIVGALDEGRVELAYQPIAWTSDRSVAFYEALVRVRGRKGGMQDGSAVMPPADRFGLTPLIDRRTLALTFTALAEDPELRLSVNVSPTSMDDGGWIALMRAHESDGLCERLTVEITESARIVDMARIRNSISWLHELGCRVAIDDFGVGYTSFRSLRSLGVDILKIDGSFVSSLMESEADRHFVRALVELAGNLGVTTVAEWVLDEATADQLGTWGCTYLQGELIGLARPLPRRGLPAG